MINRKNFQTNEETGEVHVTAQLVIWVVVIALLILLVMLWLSLRQPEEAVGNNQVVTEQLPRSSIRSESLAGENLSDLIESESRSSLRPGTGVSGVLQTEVAQPAAPRSSLR